MPSHSMTNGTSGSTNLPPQNPGGDLSEGHWDLLQAGIWGFVEAFMVLKLPLVHLYSAWTLGARFERGGVLASYQVVVPHCPRVH